MSLPFLVFLSYFYPNVNLCYIRLDPCLAEIDFKKTLIYFSLVKFVCGMVAQLIARWIRNRTVPGLNPIAGT